MARRNLVRVKKNHTWKFYTLIASAVLGLLLGVSLLLMILYINNNTDDYRNRFDDLTAYKINYNDLHDKLVDEEASAQAFILLYDETYMDQYAIDELDEDDDEDAIHIPLREDYRNANAQLEKFIQAVLKNNEDFNLEGDKDKYITLYVVNTSLIGNQEILTDEVYGNVGGAPALIYWNGESYSDTDSDEELTLTGGGDYINFTKVLRDATQFVSEIQ